MPERLDKTDENYQATSTSVIDRIRYLIARSNSTQGRFAKRIGMDAANFSKVMSGNLKLSDSFLNRLVVELGVSKKWLLRGEGTPYEKNAGNEPDVFNAVAITENNYKKGAPVYDIDVTAGVTELSRMFTRENVIGFIDYPKLDPKCSVVKVSGDSMMPTIYDGAMIAIHPVSADGVILWGQIYVIVLEDYRLVKVIKKHTDPSKVILHSDNSAYDDIEINRKDIIALYYVDVIMNYKIM